MARSGISVGDSTVGARDARTQFGRLLDRVEKGETFVIARHGEPVARLLPFTARIDTNKVRRAVRKILALQKTQTLGGRSVGDLLHDGHDL
jgi:prevent-host-death family protein